LNSYAGWKIETVDFAGDVGAWTSIALDADGNPHISYIDFTNSALKYARYDGNLWHIEIVDSDGVVGEYSSIALDVDGNPAISYFDRSNSALKYARYDGNSWHIETVDSDGNVGRSTSIALDADGNPHISYHDNTNEDLKYARYVPDVLQINITTNQGTYTTGDTLIVEGEINNPSDPYLADLRIWIKIPATDDTPEWYFQLIKLNDFTIPSGTLGPVELFDHTFNGGEPAGEYEVGGRILHPNTGEHISESIKYFTFSP
jgi:hypothetical protein